MARYSTLAPGVAAFASTPLAGVLGTLVRRWSVLTLEALALGHNRFNELQRRLGGITHKVLIGTLRSLQRDGFVHGPLTGDGVTQYRLTPLGVELVELIAQMRVWCDDRQDELAAARTGFEVDVA
jgi:DNA-binding HxlR family transcriptional regulator